MPSSFSMFTGAAACMEKIRAGILMSGRGSRALVTGLVSWVAVMEIMSVAPGDRAYVERLLGSCD
jgi:hypothetical protein